MQRYHNSFLLIPIIVLWHRVHWLQLFSADFGKIDLDWIFFSFLELSSGYLVLSGLVEFHSPVIGWQSLRVLVDLKKVINFLECVRFEFDVLNYSFKRRITYTAHLECTDAFSFYNQNIKKKKTIYSCKTEIMQNALIFV